MTTLWFRSAQGLKARVLVATGLVLALNGCSLDKVTIPELEGPSELGTAVTLTVSPDVLVADGFSTASVQATVRNQNGQLVSGRQIFFTIASAQGLFADIGSLNSTTALTGNNGIAQVIYKAPPRTDATAHQTVLIAARPVGDDFNGGIYREARIELRSAEPLLFPANSANCQPTDTPGTGGCPFARIAVEPSSGVFAGNQVLFQGSASYDSPDHNGRQGTIVRYQWDFGDGGREDKPDVNHAFLFAGTYGVTLVVTDDEGASAIGSAVVIVE